MSTQREQARTGGTAGLAAVLTTLRDQLVTVRFPLALPDAKEATRTTAAIVSQLDDYLLPRLGRLDAPLLVVVGGSTGAGKSTLVNSLVRAPVSPAGVLRPTTRSPVLVCHPEDAQWFREAHVLPDITRTTVESRTTVDDVDEGLRVVATGALAAGLAFLDAPDIDSVVERNRELALQLLAAADLWLFVTTAARYADAVPWDLLQTARNRGTALAMVLDRVPVGAADKIAPHLTRMLEAHGFGGIPLFVLPESKLDRHGLLAESVVAPLRQWFSTLAQSAADRAAVVRQTVNGAIAAIGPAIGRLAGAADHQVTVAQTLTTAVWSGYREAETAVERGVRDGALLRGEVLARWQELVGTGELMRGVQARVARLRDRVAAAVTGKPAPAERLEAAVESGLVTLIRGAAADAAEQAAAAWRAHPAGVALLTLDGHPDLGAPSPDFSERAERMVRDWQRGVLDLVRTEAGNKRFVARASAYAVNGLGLVVMVAVFTATHFIPTGAEIAVAGGTTVAAQKLLEAIFGDQAVRELADKARQNLLERVRALLEADATRFLARLDEAGVDPESAERLRRAAASVQTARASAPLHSGATHPGATR